MLRTHNQPCIVHKGQGRYEEVFLVGEHNGNPQFLCWNCCWRILRNLEISTRVIEGVKTKWQR